MRGLTAFAAVLLTGSLAACQSAADDSAVSADVQDTQDSAAHATVTPTESGSDVSEQAAADTAAEMSSVATVEEQTSAEATTQAAEATTQAAEASEEEPAPQETQSPYRDDVIAVSELATFTTPAQAAYCIFSAPTGAMAASISCEVPQSSVPMGEPLMGVCDAEGIGWFFNFFADSGHGGFFCNHTDGITRGGGNPHYWSDDPWIDPNNVVTLPSGARVAVLDYGRVMIAGDLQCSVQPDGLTCTAAGSGHGFTVNSASYTSW